MTSTHAQLAYQHLRSRLIAGEYQPGSRIRYRPVGQELGISATPVREAIEPYAAVKAAKAAKAAERASESQLSAISRTLGRMQTLIIGTTGNQTMLRSSESSNALVRVFATERHTYDADIMESTCDDHASISKAIRAGQPDVARDAMQRHIAAGLQLTLNTIESRETHRWEVQ